MLAPETVNCQELTTLNAGEKPSANFKATPEDFQVIEQLTSKMKKKVSTSGFG